MATATSHPPPAHSYHFPQSPLQQPQQQQQYPSQQNSAAQRPSQPSRKSRSFSFRSDKSHGSSGNQQQQKLDLIETSAEKDAKRLHSKADPLLAMQEAEPAQVAATVKSSLASLRNVQHKDVWGNPIADPDRSNPTRSRWERPLDTIRSFEAAIDGGYNNRRSMIRPGTIPPTKRPQQSKALTGNRYADAESSNNRRSYYNNNNNNGNGSGGRFSHDSYYGSRPTSMMYAERTGGSQQDLRQMNGGYRDAYDQQSGYHPHTPLQNGRQRWQRMQSEPQNGYRQNHNEYSLPSNHRSYETVTTASGSGSSGEPAGYQTDPTSSDNSSIERVQSGPKRQPEPVNDYGIGFSQSTAYQPPTFSVGPQSSSSSSQDLNNYQVSGAQSQGPPPQVPQKEPRGTILRKQVTAPVNNVQQRPDGPEKRKSWFSRRFSKHG
ncbi:meiotically up-regulated gene 9 protein [Podospora fimiseda]|uniref:Meiotically up-regulated gene 9 protein n=1 Tax=Podospora fimiseda TaxID=252190 RepID=A0AAN7H067_9PEZI|nr:meiotically up-regulated gene 9 protein [Podospora fimiseda]